MRAMWTRNGAAAGLFVVLGIGIAVLAVTAQSVVLAALAVVAFVAAAAATRGFPIDRDW
ncbi:MAG TPA: hypothetical protein VE011_08965 [Candidatus Dormibacteraeota bacterium]|nr:hypothetical protein [Candidatus Dormibacteraeota bacterium]